MRSAGCPNDEFYRKDHLFAGGSPPLGPKPRKEHIGAHESHVPYQVADDSHRRLEQISGLEIIETDQSNFVWNAYVHL